MNKKIFIIPFALFFITIFILVGRLILDRNPSELPSALINKNVPIFESKILFDDKIFYSKNEFNKETTLVNFFSTWCAPCLAEHNYLLRIANEKKIRIIGINYKDNNKKTIKWLNELGNPYTDVLIDSNGRLGINWGVYGIPETYIIDSNGLIKYRLVGPINKKNYKSFIKKIVSIEK